MTTNFYPGCVIELAQGSRPSIDFVLLDRGFNVRTLSTETLRLVAKKNRQHTDAFTLLSIDASGVGSSGFTLDFEAGDLLSPGRWPAELRIWDPGVADTEVPNDKYACEVNITPSVLNDDN